MASVRYWSCFYDRLDHSGARRFLFGMRWLSKAILRAAGIIPLHDEGTAFAAGTAALREHRSRLEWLAGLAGLASSETAPPASAFGPIAGIGRNSSWRETQLVSRYFPTKS
jgi:uncharacterized membrane protein